VDTKLKKLDKNVDLLDAQIKTGLNEEDIKLLRELEKRVNDLENLKKANSDIEFNAKNQYFISNK